MIDKAMRLVTLAQLQIKNQEQKTPGEAEIMNEE